MKLAPQILIKNLPPKLRELALKRALEDRMDNATALEKTVGGAFIWSDTPEGIDFWGKIQDGEEFEWQEGPISNKWDGTGSLPERWAIKRDEDNYAEIEAWYFKKVKSYSTFPTNRAHPYLHYPLQGCGSSSSIQKGYTEISMEQFRKHVMKKAEFPITPKQSSIFKRGDRVRMGDYFNHEAYFIGIGKDLDTLCIVERIDGEGWPKTNNPELILPEYTPIVKENYWSCSLASLSLVEDIAEIPKDKFQIGDRVEAIISGWKNGVGRVMNKGEKGIVTKVSGDMIYLKSEVDGVEICRKEDFIKKISKEELSKGAMGIYNMIEEMAREVKPGNTASSIQHRELGIDWERLKSVKTSAIKPESNFPGYGSYTWEIPTSSVWKESRRVGYTSAIDAMRPQQRLYNACMDQIGRMIGGEKNAVEKLPREILITKKKEKRRKLI